MSGSMAQSLLAATRYNQHLLNVMWVTFVGGSCGSQSNGGQECSWWGRTLRERRANQGTRVTNRCLINCTSCSTRVIFSEFRAFFPCEIFKPSPPSLPWLRPLVAYGFVQSVAKFASPGGDFPSTRLFTNNSLALEWLVATPSMFTTPSWTVF